MEAGREEQRLAVLERLDVLDADVGDAPTEIVRLATLVTGAPVAAVVLVDRRRAVPLAAVGIDLGEVLRDGTLADRVVRTGEAVLLEDPAGDELLAGDPLLADGDVRHVAAVPVELHGVVIGMLAVADPQPVALDEGRVEALRLVAARLAAELDLRRARVELALELGARDLVRRDDELTGLPVRRVLYERAAVEFARHRRHGVPLAVAVVELDGFEELGESLGPRRRGALLQAVARSLVEAGRAADIVGRWDDHRFVVVVPDTPAVGVPVYLQRLRAAVAAAHHEGAGTTASVGGVVVGEAAPTFADALVAAEGALARARGDGGDGVQVVDGGRTAATD